MSFHILLFLTGVGHQTYEWRQILRTVSKCNKSGECLIFLFHTTESIFWCTIIYFVSADFLCSSGTSVGEHQNKCTKTWKNHFSGGNNYGIMLGHYATYLSLLFFCTTYIGGAIFIKWSKRSLENDDDTIMLYTWYGHDTYHNISRGSQDLGILLSWLCTKYQYHFPLELLIFVSALLIRPMAYFYTFLRPGNQFLLAKLILGMSSVKSSTKIFLSVNIEKFFGKTVNR